MERDTLVDLLVSLMVALLRLADALAAVRRGVPVEALRPRRLVELDEEARRYVEEMLAAREEKSDG